jgi:lysophospholipase L1-like esterase
MKLFKYLAALIVFSLSSQVFAMKTCILMGDSIMSSVSPSTVGGPLGSSNQLAASLLMNERNVSIRNVSSPGIAIGINDYSGWGPKQKINDMLGTIGGAWSAYDCIIIQAGTNDFTRDVKWENTVTNLRIVLTHAKAMKKKVLIMEPIWRRDQNIKNKVGNTLDTYRFFMYIVCMQEYANTCYYESRSSSALADAKASQYFDANEVKAKKELHLNAAGHRVWTDWVKLAASKYGIF